MFLLLGRVSEGWQIRESSAGEITSVLMGPHVDVGRVALDPAPEMLAQKTGGLVSLKRERFMDIILGKVRRVYRAGGCPSLYRGFYKY